MRKRSGALHSTNQEEYLKLAVEQQKQFQDIYTLQQKKLNDSNEINQEETSKKKKKKPVYDMRPFIDLQVINSRKKQQSLQNHIINCIQTKKTKQILTFMFKSYIKMGNDTNKHDDGYDNQNIYRDIDYTSASSTTKSRDEIQEYNEDKSNKTQVINIMLLTQFQESFIQEIYKINSFNSTQNSFVTSKNQMLDLVIETQQIDPKLRVVYKLWMHNISSSRSQSFYNQIIEEIHYSRCSQFILLYEEGNPKSEKEINQQFEKMKKIKKDEFQATFVGVTQNQNISPSQQLVQFFMNQILRDIQSQINSQYLSYNILMCEVLLQIEVTKDESHTPHSQNTKRIVVNSNKLTSCIRKVIYNMYQTKQLMPIKLPKIEIMLPLRNILFPSILSKFINTAYQKPITAELTLI